MIGQLDQLLGQLEELRARALAELASIDALAALE